MNLDTISYILGKKAGGGGKPINLQEKEVEITENGEQTITADSGYDGLSKVDITTNVSGGDTPEAPEKDVNFYDHTGFRHYSYTKDEFLALESFPANPELDGFTAQGWNWDYQAAKDYVTEYGILDVGQTYTTDDDTTRLYVELQEGRLSPCVGIGVNGSATIDWGDNTQPTILEGTSNTRIDTTHDYAKAGEYIIKISKNTDETVISMTGDYNSGSYLFYSNSNNSYINNYYRKCVKKIELSSKIFSPNTATFKGFSNLQTINIPFVDNIRQYGNMQTFDGVSPLMYIIPKNITQITGSNAFSSPKKRLILSNNFLTWANNGISIINLDRFVISPSMNINGLLCNYLTRVIYTRGTKIISGSATSLRAAKYLDFSHHTAIPTNNSTTTFYIPTDCQIVVPDDLYEDWIVATNWSTYASQIIKKSDWEAQQ